MDGPGLTSTDLHKKLYFVLETNTPGLNWLVAEKRGRSTTGRFLRFPTVNFPTVNPQRMTLPRSTLRQELSHGRLSHDRGQLSHGRLSQNNSPTVDFPTVSAQTATFPRLVFPRSAPLEQFSHGSPFKSWSPRPASPR